MRGSRATNSASDALMSRPSADRRRTLFDDGTGVHVQTSPLRIRPHVASDLVLLVDQGVIARRRIRAQHVRRPLFDHPAVLYDQDLVEVNRVGHVMSHAEKRRPRVVSTGSRQKVAPVGPAQAPQRFVQNRQAHSPAAEGAGGADALPLAARNQRPALADPRLQSLGRIFQDAVELGRGRWRRRCARALAGRFRNTGCRTDVDRNRCTWGSIHAVSPRSCASSCASSGLVVDPDAARGRRMPAEQAAEKRRLPRARDADDADVLAGQRHAA